MDKNIILHAVKTIEAHHDFKINESDVSQLHDTIHIFSKIPKNIYNKSAYLEFKRQPTYNAQFYRVKGICSRNCYTDFFQSLHNGNDISSTIEFFIKSFFEKGKVYEQFESFSFSNEMSFKFEDLVADGYSKSRKQTIATFNYSDRSTKASAQRHKKNINRTPTTTVISSHLDLLIKEDSFVPAITLYIPIIADLKFAITLDMNVNVTADYIESVVNVYEKQLRVHLYNMIKEYRGMAQHEKLLDVKDITPEQLIDLITVEQMINY